MTGIDLVAREPSEGLIPVTCRCCAFDAVLPFRLFSLNGEGVAPCGFYVACTRCIDMDCGCTGATQ